MLLNVEKFFEVVRANVFAGRLLQKQVDGINAILKAFRAYGDDKVEHLAYLLATAYHETWAQMQPVIETQSARDIARPLVSTAIRRLEAAYAAGKLTWVKTPYWRDGWLGRGFVQVTHKRNYERIKAETGYDTVSNPDLLFELDFSARVLVQGCLEGWWTGKKLSDYTNYYNMRLVVNGTESADKIAVLADKFERALRAAQIVEPAKPEERESWWQALWVWFFGKRRK